MNEHIPIINGLVLAGGKSKRMGTDKGKAKWYHKEQRYHMADLLAPFCREVFISCRADQVGAIHKYYKTIVDAYLDAGPTGGILSAFLMAKDKAWLVVACDLPLIDNETLLQLILNRDAAAIATTFESPFDGLPEPLITIWEPQSFEVLQAALSQGKSCPRKVLINHHPKIIKPKNEEALLNANTPEDAAKVAAIIKSRETKMGAL